VDSEEALFRESRSLGKKWRREEEEAAPPPLLYGPWSKSLAPLVEKQVSSLKTEISDRAVEGPWLLSVGLRRIKPPPGPAKVVVLSSTEVEEADR
jgi:hypothetical protein